MAFAPSLETRSPARRRLFLLAAAALLLLLNLWIWAGAQARPARLSVAFLDVGQGDGIVAITPAGHVLVVDAGPRTPTDDAGRRVMLPYLRSQGVNRVDAVVLTHPDEDHVGGSITLMDRIAVRELLVSGVPDDTETWNRVLQTANERHVPVIRLVRGERLDFGDGVTGEVLNPGGDEQPTPNNGSVVIRLRYGTTSVLLTGDAERGAEHEMERTCFANTLLHADILKVAHHGSHTSSTEQFLEDVRPEAAVISVGRHNRFGHPSPEVLDRLEALHIPTFRTDRDGAVVAVSDGRTVRITTTLHQR